MDRTKTSGRFETKFVEARVVNEEFVQVSGWYIRSHDLLDRYGVRYLWTLDDGELWFGCQRDAELAVSALVAAGLTTDDQLAALSDDEMKRICYGALPW